MIPDHWAEVLKRICLQAPVNLDDIIGTAPSNPTRGRVLAVTHAETLPSAQLWARGEPLVSYIGIRVQSPLADCTHAAMRLAGAALERRVVPVILTTLPSSGFERFGFRVERVGGTTQQEIERAEQQLARFWNLVIIIDAADMDLLH
jgi:hypothetical protein